MKKINAKPLKPNNSQHLHVFNSTEWKATMQYGFHGKRFPFRYIIVHQSCNDHIEQIHQMPQEMVDVYYAL